MNRKEKNITLPYSCFTSLLFSYQTMGLSLSHNEVGYAKATLSFYGEVSLSRSCSGVTITLTAHIEQARSARFKTNLVQERPTSRSFFEGQLHSSKSHYLARHPLIYYTRFHKSMNKAGKAFEPQDLRQRFRLEPKGRFFFAIRWVFLSKKFSDCFSFY